MSWKGQEIDVIFHHDDVIVIKGIPLSTRSLDDIFTWGITGDEVFIVSCAYYLSYVLSYKTNSRVINDFWKWLWGV